MTLSSQRSQEQEQEQQQQQQQQQQFPKESKEKPTANYSFSPHHTSKKQVELALGKLLGEGAFSAIYELSTVKDLTSEEWILAPPPKSSSNGKQHHRRGHSAFAGLVGGGEGGIGGATAASPLKRRNSTTKQGHQSMGVLPPLMKSVELQFFSELINPKADDEDNPKEVGASRFRRSNSTATSLNNSNKSKGPSYVVKCLKSSVISRGQFLQQGLKDMQVEADVLQRLSHPNILPLRATGTMALDDIASSMKEGRKEGSAAAATARVREYHDFSDSCDDDEGHPHHKHYRPPHTHSDKKPQHAHAQTSETEETEFPVLILDHLAETLEDKLKFWEAKNQKNSSLVGKLVTHRRYDKSSFFAVERMTILCNIASAIQYMHRQKIIYRDLKPENVGFDRLGQLKLFDFGLAKDLNKAEHLKDGLYKLTGLTGSARYMAPEVAKELPYNSKCDVYALAILIWEVMALKQPYSKYNVREMFQRVYDTPHVRPNLEELGVEREWLADLLENMWISLIADRWTVDQVLPVLEDRLRTVQQQQQKQQAEKESGSEEGSKDKNGDQ